MADHLVGKAVLTVNLTNNNVQISNFGSNSFQITNTGQKTIAQVEIDVTNALYPDSVFDPFGLAGDTASKSLQIDTNGNTGIVAPSTASYIGVGGRAGYEGIRLVFNPSINSGFQPGETLGFSVDMDPNSVAGTSKSQLDGGSSPSWDVGGVSGAELIGSTFTVTFTDGTTATGQLQGAGNQGGSKGIAAQDSPNLGVTLSVNGLNPGSIGTYGSSGPSVIINGPAGKTARVVLTKGVIQPVNPYAAFLQAQLSTLAASNFPANNAVEFQTVNVQLTGTNQNISNLFNFSNVAAYNFAGEDKLPLGFVASVIDPSNSDLPLGSVTQPIYLKFSSQSTQPNQVNILSTQNAAEPSSNGLFTVSLNAPVASNTVVSYSVSGTATPGSDYTTLSGTVTIPANQLSATIPVAVLNDALVDGSESVIVTLTGVSGTAGVGLGAVTTATVAIADDDLPVGTLTVQAESIANVTGYRLESNAAATGGSMLSFIGGDSNETGTATFTFNGGTGTYNVILGTFDEADGISTLQVSKNGASIGSVLLNENRGSSSADAATKVEKLVASGINIANGDSLTVTGIENNLEHARFDFIRFEPASSASKQVSIATTQNAAEPSSNGLFTVSLSAPSSTNTVVSYSVSGTATPGSDYTTLSGTVTIPANQLSATIPVAVLNDVLVDSSETVIVTLTGVSGASDVALGATKIATVAIADDDLPVSTLTVQAESIANVTGYRLESNGSASGGSMLSFIGGASNETGTATFSFAGATGTYNVILGTFDEADGISTLQVSKNGASIGSVLLNENRGSNSADAATKVEKLVASGVNIANGDSLTITGIENNLEHARFDFIRFEPVGSASPLAFLEAPQNGVATSNKLASDHKLASEPLHSLEQIASDMELPHEGKLKGVPDHYSWALNPEIVMGNNPGNFKALMAWGQVYADAAGSSAQNTRIQIRNIKTYVLSQKTKSWSLVQGSTAVEGAAFKENYADNISVPANIRDEPDGSISVKLTPGYNYHFWPKGGRVTINPNDVAGVFTTVEARLIVDNLARPDDRSNARFLVGVGADYWLNTTASWDYFKTNGAIASGRLRYVDSQWDSFNMTTLTKDELYTNPPPIPLSTTYSVSDLGSGSLTGDDLGAVGSDAALLSATPKELAMYRDFGSAAFHETDGLISAAERFTLVETKTKPDLKMPIEEGDRNQSIVASQRMMHPALDFEPNLFGGDLIMANQY